MKREDLTELHYITSIQNVPSIMKLGILSNKLVEEIHHVSVASPGVQNRRDKKKIPGGLKLHEYANLYIHARNIMFFKVLKRESSQKVCVLRVSLSVLDLDNVVVSDTNAARELVGFRPPDEGLRILKKDEVFAEFWTDPDPTEHYRKAGVKCAEVLVPNKVAPDFILGAYVSSRSDKATLRLTGANIPCIIDKHLFFK